MAARNIKLVMCYDGGNYAGWQIQPGARTVQETLEKAIFALTGEKVHANASGRTDAGVHALGQVVNFFTSSHLEPDVFVRGLNAHLPNDIAIREAADVPAHFDANRNAKRKMYRYVIYNGPVRDPFLRRYSYHCRYPLDVARMQRAGKVLVGTHDFRSFETDYPNRVSSVRTITSLSVEKNDQTIRLEVEADGFLYNMVRAIAGTLINVGRGYWPEEKVAEILQAQDRRQAGPTAPPQGLFLVRVAYDESDLTQK
ncbi:MAG: tRNA pseudouridine synthase A [Gemmatales bacterium]|nr:MAG: tRNA pseudouridine synthase A [Gemmatales bacterium]